MTHRVLPPTRVLAVIAPVCAAGLGVACAAAVAFAITPHKTTTVIGIAALLAASTLADRFPVPVEGIDAGGVSLSFVFGVASIVLFLVTRDAGAAVNTVAVLAVAAAVLYVTQTVRTRFGGASVRGERIAVIVALAVIGTVLLLWWQVGNRPDGVGFSGIASIPYATGVARRPSCNSSGMAWYRSRKYTPRIAKTRTTPATNASWSTKISGTHTTVVFTS